MRYFSTRGDGAAYAFKDAVMTGLAPDGGLLLPEAFPDARGRLAEWAALPYQDLALEIFSLFADDFTRDELRALIAKSYSVFDDPEIAPVVRPKGSPVAVCELFHGPTLAFKDVALQFLGNCFEKILSERGGGLNVVVATSGDTGSAAIHGLHGRAGVRVFVLHPAGRVSAAQELQMTTVIAPDVFNIALDGSFDDAQAVVKALFNDLPFKAARRLGSVNSINWARILAQIVYYFYAAFRVMAQYGAKQVSFSVPTGNFGDIFAGYSAALMGLPVAKLVLATNENDILARFFNSGVYAKADVARTISPSMDIQVASNFERWLALKCGRDAAALRRLMDGFALTGALSLPLGADGRMDPFIAAGSADAAQTLETIRRFHEKHSYVLDPHTAAGAHAALEHLSPEAPMICLATAHPAKFPDAVAAATCGAARPRAPALEALKGMPARKTQLPNDARAVADFIAANT